jgi:hypothetical protein
MDIKYLKLELLLMLVALQQARLNNGGVQVLKVILNP